jgi:hypothetical protein
MHEAAAERHAGNCDSKEDMADCATSDAEVASESLSIAAVKPKNKKCLAVSSASPSISSFQDILSAVPQSTHADLRKAMKLWQQGKEKQAISALSKLDSIDRDLRKSIESCFETM